MSPQMAGRPGLVKLLAFQLEPAAGRDLAPCPCLSWGSSTSTGAQVCWTGLCLWGLQGTGLVTSLFSLSWL